MNRAWVWNWGHGKRLVWKVGDKERKVSVGGSQGKLFGRNIKECLQIRVILFSNFKKIILNELILIKMSGNFEYL